jgi:hypothetical protein
LSRVGFVGRGTAQLTVHLRFANRLYRAADSTVARRQGAEVASESTRWIAVESVKPLYTLGVYGGFTSARGQAAAGTAPRIAGLKTGRAPATLRRQLLTEWAMLTATGTASGDTMTRSIAIR